MDNDDSECNCHILFELCDHSAFRRLVAVFDEFKRQKVSTIIMSDAHWLPYFEASDLTEFWWPDEEEAAKWNDYWFGTPLPMRHSIEMPSPPWHFGSMVEAILIGEYELISVRKIDETRGRLEISPDGYPYGGVGSLRALIRAFGHKIIGYDDGTGFVAGDEQGPRWTPGMKLPKE